MIVYFVRHGESEGNAKDVHQTPTTPLSDIGLSQAALVAHRFKNISVEIILSSDHKRTMQTAGVINKILNIEIVPTPLLQEFHRPSEIFGRKTNDPFAVEIRKLLYDHRNEPEWHYSDEENFFEFKLRARECLRMISDRSESKILCVTHGVMLVMILCIIIFGDELTQDNYEKMLHQFHNENTGITMCEFDNGKWILRTWNDHAHLG